MSEVFDEVEAWALVLEAKRHPTGAYEPPADSEHVTAEARDILAIYLPLLSKTDLVLGQLGQSLDGRIATEGGASHFVTGPEDLTRLHRLRALVDAVVVGANTVAEDDPQLTVRRVEGDNPVRVVLDPNRRLDPSRVVFGDTGARTIVVHEGAAHSVRGDEIVVPMGDSGLDLEVLLDALRAQGLRRLLVEGGGVTVSRFLAAGLLDRLHITVAPMLIGSGRPSLTLSPIASLDQALRPAFRHFRLGSDVLFDLDLRTESQ
jgi:diaminohydroxyphosphoribosylaminopyrimidine deaminase/5-amino-6-(5-phosphoribosylamino)uracil reductase